MLKSKHYQWHGANQRRPHLSLEVTEQELMGRSRSDSAPAMPRHLPLSVGSSPLSDGREPLTVHCPVPTVENLPTPYLVATPAATATARCNGVVATHQQHIYLVLAHRLRAAYERGDMMLVQLLQQEAAQYTC